MQPWHRLLLVYLSLGGCVNIPPQAQLISAGGRADTPAESCPGVIRQATAPDPGGLNPHGFRLLVWNLHLHGINFTIGSQDFSDQLARARAVIATHRGPLIVAGDFNTWSRQRHGLLITLANDLGLTPVNFSDDRRTRVNGLPLDHVLYRGLRVLHADVGEQPQSDHNPLSVQFAMPTAASTAVPLSSDAATRRLTISQTSDQ